VVHPTILTWVGGIAPSLISGSGKLVLVARVSLLGGLEKPSDKDLGCTLR